MRSRIYVWLVAIALLVPVLANAAGTCYQWRVTASDAWRDSADQAAVDFIQRTQNTDGTCKVLVSVQVTSFPTYTLTYRESYTDACDTWKNTATQSILYRVNPEGCPECADMGTEKTLDGASGSAPSSTCVNGCSYSRTGPYINFQGSGSGLSGYIGSYTSAGVSCTQTSGNPGSSSTQNDCKATSTDVYCMVQNQNGENCGQVNGEWFCAKSTKPGTCTSTASGGAVCGSNRTDGKTETPPGPDNGTAGTPATPTASVKDDATGRVTNYYNNSTVTNSTTNSGSSSSGSSGSSSSSSSGGSSSSSSSATCTGDCDFDAPENEQVGTVAETGNSFVSRMYNAPIVAAVSQVGASLPAGVCPQGTLNLFGTAITMDMHCTLMSDIAPVISAVMLACWCFLGLRILMSA